MSEPTEIQNGPLVTVLVPTFNRRRYLFEALESLVGQTYGRFEAFVINDGGEPVGDLVASFNDPRIRHLERRENRGKAASLNEALQHARGKYVAYLDDDDRYYPHHLARLVDALEGDTDCGAAYTDLYKVHCRILADGSRQVLGKVVNISRDFDRFLLGHFNHVLHVSLAHRRDLLDRTGPYNESLRVLVDWDMTRRLAFFTDFRHVADVTGEFYGPVGACDRLSYRMRLDRTAYLAQVMAIRTTRPPKPWPRMPDLSIVYLADAMDAAAAEALRRICVWTFMPYEVYLPLPGRELARLRTAMTNLVRVPVADLPARAARLDEALRRVQGDWVAVVPQGTHVDVLWVEDPLYAAVHHEGGGVAFAVSGGAGGDWPAVVVRREDLLAARQARPGATLAESLAAAGLAVREPGPKERAFPFDRLLQEAEAMETEGDWARAASVYRRTGEQFGNARWMRERAARALYRAGRRDAEALKLCLDLNRRQPTVSTLLLEAKLLRRADENERAVGLLERAECILTGRP